jgi:hypothetical protein
MFFEPYGFFGHYELFSTSGGVHRLPCHFRACLAERAAFQVLVGVGLAWQEARLHHSKAMQKLRLANHHSRLNVVLPTVVVGAL